MMMSSSLRPRYLAGAALIAAAFMLVCGSAEDAGALPMAGDAAAAPNAMTANPVDIWTLLGPRAMALDAVTPPEEVPLHVGAFRLPLEERYPPLTLLQGREQLPARDEARPRDDTLRQVMRSMVTVHRADNAFPERRRLDAGEARGRWAEERGGSDVGVDIAELLLDSEMAGAALRAVVDIKSSDGQFTTFSVFGIGDFALETTQGMHGLTISELSSGWSETLSGRSGPTFVEYSPGGNGYAGAPVRTNLVRTALTWILDFFMSPFGLILDIIAVVVLLLWVTVKSVAVLQRRSTYPRRD